MLTVRISAKLQYYDVAGERRKRECKICSPIINNLLNRGLLRIATQREGQKFRAERPRGFLR